MDSMTRQKQIDFLWGAHTTRYTFLTHRDQFQMDSASHQKQALTVSQAESQTHNYPQPIFTAMAHCAQFQVDSVNRQKQTDSTKQIRLSPRYPYQMPLCDPSWSHLNGFSELPETGSSSSARIKSNPCHILSAQPWPTGFIVRVYAPCIILRVCHVILKSYRRDVLRALINPVFVDFPQTLWAFSVSDCDIFRWIEWVDTLSLDFPHNHVTCSFLTPCDHFQMDSTGHWTQAVTGTHTPWSGYP